MPLEKRAPDLYITAVSAAPNRARPSGPAVSGLSRGIFHVRFRSECRGRPRRLRGPRGRLRCRPARAHDPRLQLHGLGGRADRRRGLPDLPDGGRRCDYRHRRQDRRPDPAGPVPVRRPVHVGADAGAARDGAGAELRHPAARRRDRLAAVLRLCRHPRRIARDHLHRLHRELDRQRVLHLGGGVRRD